MSARGFGSLVMASSVAAAALGCYLVSLKVASERAKLESVEAQIVMAERDIRVLETEIGTRGRLAQLERWNANFIRLSAPSADQILEGGFQLATMIRPPERHAVEAPVVLASAPAPAPREVGEQIRRDDAGEEIAALRPKASARPDEIMHVAGYRVPEKKELPVEKALKAQPKTPASTNSRKVATADPLSPLPTAKPAAKAPTSKPPKESSKSQ